MKHRILLLIPFICFMAAQAQPVTPFLSGKYPAIFSHTFNGNYVFVITNDSGKDELWCSNGTAAGNRKLISNVVDYFDGKSNAVASTKSHLFVLAKNGSTCQLTAFDKNFQVTQTLDLSAQPAYGLVASDQYAFFISDGNVMRSDGSNAGTIQLSDFSESGRIVSGTATPDGFFFSMTSNGSYKPLWFTNGEPGPLTTYEVLAYDSVNYNKTVVNHMPGATFTAGNRFCFTYGKTMWSSDGTTGNTYKIMDSITLYNNYHLPCIGYRGNGYFATSDNTGISLYRTNGKPNGTELLFPNISLYPPEFYAVNNHLIMLCNRDNSGSELWSYDLSRDSLFLLRDIFYGPHTAFGSDNSSFPTLRLHKTPGSFRDSLLIFSASDTAFGKELWQTDGTSNHTRLFTDLRVGKFWSNPAFIQCTTDKIFVNYHRGFKEYVMIAIDPVSLPAPDTNITASAKGEWLRTIGAEYNYYTAEVYAATNFSLSLGNNGDIFLAGGQQSGNSICLFDHKEKYPWADKFWVQYDRNGNLKQFKAMTTNDRYARGGGAADLNNHYYFASSYRNTVNIEGTVLNNSNGFFLAGWNENGNIKWVRQGSAVQSVTLTYVGADINREYIFVAGYYRGYSMILENGPTLSSNVSPKSFLIKYDRDGNIKWASNIADLTANYNATIRKVITDPYGNVFVLSTQGNLNTASSCKFRPWYITLNKLNANGQLLWTKHVAADDLTMAYDMALSPFNELYITGGFRGNLFMDNKIILSSDEDANGCNVFTSLILAFDGNGGLLRRFTDNPQRVFPMQIKFTASGEYYLWGYVPDASDETKYDTRDWPFFRTNSGFQLVKMNSANQALEKKLFLQPVYDFEDYHFHPLLELDEGFAVAANMGTSNLHYFSNTVQGVNQNIQVFRFSIKNAGFLPQPDPENLRPAVFPNPLSDYFYISVDDFPNKYFRYELFDITGRRVDMGESDGFSPRKTINMSHLIEGAYFLRIYTTNKTFSYKLVKPHAEIKD